ncbi:P-loop containing nucleoside triphosphate hydrolase protein [Cokeromyces recurvatus]|uniref:P-loop containing nucleoside triphosphate hydrolase protein n=1 Tax=Cokeromyces recurvatus TaxID=90255 RepID=UPI00222001A8|nr:P-loop containing nucleoside triphosphate hydrolase protein [Cokeromyces recurvatus]KAI7897583.1 P-loop containing nucleoside triphosphate hydrolase protein [Cokeromyces recurvatus]
MSDQEDHVHKKTRTVLKSISNPSIRKLPLPLSRVNKNYDAKAVLSRKFKVPSMIPKSTDGKPAPILPQSNEFGEKKTLGIRRRAGHMMRALYDHTAEDAIVLWDPDNQPIQEEIKITTDKPKKKGKSLAEILGLKKEERKLGHVVVDPALGRVLRPHQIEGVKFLYQCTTGKVYPDAYGCIMADEMGLGKTLQCITLVWTLLQQSEEIGKPTVQKAIITCPSSLVKNWANEFVKWLGATRVQPLTVDNGGSKEKIASVKRWGASQGKNSILIISYESLRAYTKYLQKCQIGILLCDEGHRLKNRDSKLFQELNSLQVQRRVILSGTPIQNDLSEYYALLDFANPGLLGTPNEFRRNYENPILRGRDADASEKEREISDEKVAEFWNIVSKFTIRRTNDILTKYLPTKYEHVVFCKLAPLQEALYNIFITSSEIKNLLKGQGCQALKNITFLKKLCNHPNLLNLPEDLEGSKAVLPSNYTNGNNGKIDPSFSGKFMVLARMLAKIKKETKDKIVLISNYTQTLDLFETYCKQNQYGVLRLDGSMNITKRQKLVDQFNNPEGEEFVFLLSSKAGGCGLNLIGANRLVLFDPDWNPAADQQALARVWRDGQKKDCFIYRFIATGTIEEKIFQRQSHKQSLSNCVVDEADMERHFSVADMRQLFTLHTKSDSETHDTFKCKRCIQGKQHTPAETMSYGDSSTWNHYDKDLRRLPDPILISEAQKGIVSYVFQYISHMK